MKQDSIPDVDFCNQYDFDKKCCRKVMYYIRLIRLVHILYKIDMVSIISDRHS
jgi:hypothetical protein